MWSQRPPAATALEPGRGDAAAAEALTGVHSAPPAPVAHGVPAPDLRRGLRAILTRLCQFAIPPRIWFFYAVGLSFAGLRRVLRIAGAFRGGGEEVLYVARNGLSVMYVLENARLLSERGDARCAVTAPPWLRRRMMDQARAAGLPIRYVSVSIAVLARWRLVVHSHHFLGHCFDRATPSVYISHGIETGKKTLYDASYTYGCQGLRTPHEPLYRAMIATHAAERVMAGRAYPAYREVVTTSTDAVLERLIVRAGQRASIRARLGIPRDRPVALFMSTWGHPSLVSSHGEGLALEIERLAEDFALFLAVHPKRRRARHRQSVLKRLEARGMVVLPPGTPWIDHLAVADVTVSDITSMCLYSSLLGTPVVFLGAALERLVPGGLVEDLVRRSPRADDPRELRCRLLGTLRQPTPEFGMEIRGQFPHAGDADHLVRTMNALIDGPPGPAARRRD